MAKFFNPYHFVPVVKPSALKGTKPPADGDGAIAEFEKGHEGLLRHVTHDRYVEGTRSGRLVCRLETLTPAFVGGSQTRKPSDESPGEYSPFELRNEPAIPASSLRGMISAVAEAASSSALRVLDRTPYSRRANLSPEETLSAVGLITKVRDDGSSSGYELRPLTIPTLQSRSSSSWTLGPWQPLFPHPTLRAYIQGQTLVEKVLGWTRNRLVGMRLAGGGSTLPPGPITYQHHFKAKPEGAPRFLLGQRVANGTDIRPWDDTLESRGYTRGFLMALDIPKDAQRPPTKKHELFVPYPTAAEAWPTFPIPEGVIETFYELAHQRATAQKEGHSSWPFVHVARPGPERSRRYELRAGDLVYFGIDERTGDINAISFSSVWRKFAGPRGSRRTSAWSYFREVDKELLPFNPERRTITIAERIFGFVAQPDSPETGPTDTDATRIKALAGRVRFAHALHERAPAGPEGVPRPYLPKVTLKALMSPKPPSPAMYFKRRGGQGAYIAKDELRPDKHEPQGRKFYLHHDLPPDVDDGDTAPWKTRHEEDQKAMKSAITPLARGNVFYFHIDFDNLTDEELGLLCFALEPAGGFRHKLGMGRAIGLGSVSIRTEGLFLVHRARRYSCDGFNESRYAEAWRRPDATHWPEHYAGEKDVAQAPTARDPACFRKCFTDAFGLSSGGPGAPVQQALEWLGKPHGPIHWPTVKEQTDDEQETYRWFVVNDHKNKRPKVQGGKIPAREHLGPLPSADPRLPENPDYED